jgi:methionyl-tRNA formyltransferase
MRVIFAGTPEVAVPAFERLRASTHEVVAVITRPDARAGRGRTPRPSPIAVRAQELGIPVLAPTSLRDDSVADSIGDLAPDCCPVVAYGGLVPPALLGRPRHGWVNLHFSLLPAWRGAAPVQHALLHGDEITGATTFVLSEGLDEGPALGSLTEPIGRHDTAGDVLERLSHTGAELLVHTLDALEVGAAVAVPQPSTGVSFAPKLTSDDARVRWGEPALAVDRRIRACTPAPGAWTKLGEERLGLMPLAHDQAGDNRTLEPGVLDVAKHDVFVGTGSAAVRLGQVRPQGKRLMHAADWARGARLTSGTRLQ